MSYYISFYYMLQFFLYLHFLNGFISLPKFIKNTASITDIFNVINISTESNLLEINLKNKSNFSYEKTNLINNNINLNNRSNIRCFIVSQLEISNETKIEVAKKFVTNIKDSYDKNFKGFSFCESDSFKIQTFLQKFSFLHIEEDTLFRISSKFNDKKQEEIGYLSRKSNYKENESIGNIYFLENKEITEKKILNKNQNTFFMNNNFISDKRNLTKIIKQKNIPLHFFRLKNLGNLFFNNYILDNFLFRILRINYFIKFFYSYKYLNSGEKVSITAISTDYDSSCSMYSQLLASLMIGQRNSYAKNASLRIISNINCDGTIYLSKLLHSFETIQHSTILFLPVYGPSSKILEFVLSRIGLSTIIVIPAGDFSENVCQQNNSSNIIRVGSVNKHGYKSDFSNYGNCISVYTLGESVLGDNGTAYSAALITGAVAVFLSMYPGSSYTQVINYLKFNSIKINNNYVFKTPEVYFKYKVSKIYYYLFFIIIFLLLLFLIYKIFTFCYYSYKAAKYKNEEEINELFINDEI